MRNVVHQVRYAWSERSLLGVKGMGPVATTLPGNKIAHWDGHLRDHVSTAGDEPGFVYFVAEDVGVLLRKTPPASADARQGTAASALLGPRLDPATALGLTLWHGWDSTVLVPLDFPVLAEASGTGLDVLRVRAHRMDPERVGGLLAQVLAHPDESFTVVGESDPLALICLLGDLLGEPPTFASHEHDDTRLHLPTAVFLTGTPAFSLVTGARRRLSARAESLDGVLGPFSLALAEAYAAHGQRGIGRVRASRPPVNGDESREWARVAQYVPGVLADITLFPSTSPFLLQGLAEERTLKRIAEDALNEGDWGLLTSLRGRVPNSVRTLLLKEAVKRVFAAPGETAMLAGLADLGPVPGALLPASAHTGLDHFGRVTLLLCEPGERRHVLERAVQEIELWKLIDWIDRNAESDPEGTEAVFSVLCGRAGKALEGDVSELVHRNGLCRALRSITQDETRVSLRLVSLLGALPARHIGDPEVVDALVQIGDPVLLHALETVVPDDQLGRVLQAVHRAYYAEHQLDEPRRDRRHTPAGFARRWQPLRILDVFRSRLPR